MAYGKIYRGEWLLMDDDAGSIPCRFDIFDTTITVADPNDAEIIPLVMGANPVTVSVINNSRDKLNPSIRAKQLTAEILTENGIDISTFTIGSDLRWYVEYTINDLYIFKGFLMLPDIQQPFLPHNNLLILTASDMLASLKDVTLVDDTGANPEGPHLLIDYIAWSLQKTGLQLNIKTINNIRPGTGVSTIDYANFSSSGFIFFPFVQYTQFYSGQQLRVDDTGGLNNGTIFTVVVNNGGSNLEVTPAPVADSGRTNITLTDITSGHIYGVCYVDAKTFEKEIGESENCYTVLEKILAEDCILTQEGGEWIIYRPSELDGNDLKVVRYDYEGTVVDTSTETNVIEIGSTESLKYIKAAQSLQRDRPLNYAKIIYNFDLPLESICNINFERGDLNTTVSATQKQYDLDCWTIRQGLGAGSTTPLVTPYIERIFTESGNESERYAVIPMPPDISTANHFIESSSIDVKEKDRFDFSVDFRTDTDMNGSGATYTQRVATLRLVGDDGTYWMLDSDGVWYQSNSGWSVNFKDIEYQFIPNDVDTTEFQNVNVSAKDIPVDGSLYIDLYALNQNTASSIDDKDIYFNNLRFDYSPFIDGSYREISGQSYKYNRSETGYLSKRENTIYIDSSPRKNFKGALMVKPFSTYQLCDQFFEFHRQVFPPNAESRLPYGQILSQSVWNQYKNANWVISGTVQGLDDTPPEMYQKVQVTDAHPATTNKTFTITGYSQDWKLGAMQLTLIECYDSTIGRVYDDEFEFKYIEANG